jgi:hypothetical protein
VVDREPFSVVAQEALHTWSAQRRAQSATMAAADDAVSEGGGDGDGDGGETDKGQNNEDTGVESPHETRRHQQTHQRHSFFQSFRELKISSLRETSQRLSPALALANVVGGGTVDEQEDGDGDNEEQPQHHPRAKSVFEKIFLRADGSKVAVRCVDSSSSDGMSDRSSSGGDDDEDPGSEGRREDGLLIERYPHDHHHHHKHRHHHHRHSPDDPSSHMPPRDRDFHGAYLRACQVRCEVLLWSERVTEKACSLSSQYVGPKLLKGPP